MNCPFDLVVFPDFLRFKVLGGNHARIAPLAKSSHDVLLSVYIVERISSFYFACENPLVEKRVFLKKV
jgi:hypothetical protein